MSQLKYLWYLIHVVIAHLMIHYNTSEFNGCLQKQIPITF